MLSKLCFLDVSEHTVHFSIVAVSIYIPTNSAGENPHFNKTPRGFVCALRFERCWS